MQRRIFSRTAMMVSAVLFAGVEGVGAEEPEELEMVKAIFTEIQPLSFQKKREYCGLIGRDADGNLIASPAKRGSVDGCTPRDTEEMEVVIASYHTHGSFMRGYVSEVPSVSDMEADESDGIDGWVATPGGRLWYVDSSEMVISQVCGLGCLPVDARFERHDSGPVAESYSYDELVTFFEE
ncbi:DUF4329 domain-containing protein [Celeribacter sp.]|uniref:DUF4329 domain-containing protein n=1 Tax=Celeribacter sp. TaxID=1890673 RepID=UPI003A92CB3E